MRKMSKKDKNAINSINVFMSEVPKIMQTQTAKAWKNKVKSSLRNWLGDSNHLTVIFEEYEIKVFNHPEFRAPNDHDNLSYLNQVKEYIKIHGVIPDVKQINWIYTANKTLLYTVSSAVIICVATGSFMAGRYFKERSELKLEYRYELLVDSLRTVMLTSKISNMKDTSASQSK